MQVDLANLAKNQVETEKTSLISLRQKLIDHNISDKPYAAQTLLMLILTIVLTTGLF